MTLTMLKKYFLRLIIFNLFSIIYLIDTNSFDQGFFSFQSIFYSLNLYIYYFFIIFETISSLLSSYGLDISFIDLVFKNFSQLNYKYILFIIYQNLNFVYFILFTIGLTFFLEKNNYTFSLKKSFFKQKGLIIILIIIFPLSFFNLNLTHVEIKNKYKSLTNSWSSSDLISRDIFYYNEFSKNNFFRNDNWYNIIKYSYFYKDSYPTGNKLITSSYNKKKYIKFEMFEKIIQKENYNNIYVIINESYPNFRNQKLKNNLLNTITSGNNDLIIRNYKKDWNTKLSTLGSELDFFCNKKLNLNEFKNKNLKIFLDDNNCWINSQKNKNLVYIHSHNEKFYNRKRYKSFFDQTFFKNDLEKLNLKVCDQYFSGICDYEILDNIEKILSQEDNNFVLFLTLNNHIPTSKFYEKPFINCKQNFPLNLSEQFCHIYNNQFYFNKSISRLIKRMKKDDLVILFSDTPPSFKNKYRIHFEDLIDVYFFSNKQI